MYKLEQATPATGVGTVLKAQPVKWGGVTWTKEKGEESGRGMRIEVEKEDAEEDKGEEVEVVRTGHIGEEGGENKTHEEHPEAEAAENKEEVRGDGYDLHKRNPKLCRAEQTGLWELLYLVKHYNYLVRKFGCMILEGKAGEIDNKSNPMVDFAHGAVINQLVLQNVEQVASYAITPAENTGATENKLDCWTEKEGLNVDNFRERTFQDEGFLRVYFEQKIQRLDALECRRARQARRTTGDGDFER